MASLVAKRMALPMIGAVLLLSACGSSSSPPTGAANTSASGPTATGSSPGTTTPPPSAIQTQRPAPQESNPPGDLPDTLTWIRPPTAAGRFQIDVPEGWARTQPAPRSFVYTDNGMFNSIALSWTAAAAAPTVASARSADVPVLQHQYQRSAFALKSVAAVTLPAGPAVQIQYFVNSPPNPTTGKQQRDLTVRYELFRAGTEAIFAMTSIVNQDTVDFYNHITGSFRWL